MRNQQPIHSGFNKDSTVAEVLDGLDLAGKTALVTGGHSGLGLETTKALVNAGARVIVGSRNVEDAKQKLSGIRNVIVRRLDLANLDSVRAFSANVQALEFGIDMLICNAGVMACPETRVGEGWESQFAINHIGHYLLTNLLWDTLNDGSRVVSVSSAAHHLSPIRWDDMHFQNSAYNKWVAYGQSKTANVLFALQLDEYGKDRGIRAFSLHPGKIKTPLQRHLETEEMVEAGWIDEAGKVVDPTFKSVEQGAATQVWAATSPALNGLGGLYCEDCDVARGFPEPRDGFDGVCAHAIDLGEAQKLWEYTAALTDVNVFAAKPSFRPTP